MHHSWGFFTGGASDVAQRRVWRVLRAPLSWKEEGGVGLQRHSSGDQVLMIHCNQTKVWKEPNID